jgi:erythromycin esterase
MTLSLRLLTVILLAPAVSSAMAPSPANAQPDPCDAAAVELSATSPWRADIERGGTRCLWVELRAGELLRAVAEMGAMPPLSGALFQAFAPDGTTQVAQAGVGNHDRAALSFEAESAGRYHVVVRNVWSVDAGVREVPVQVWIQAVEPPALVGARAAALAADPRVAWLRENAHALRSIDPADDDFSDLEPLRATLANARVVLLGEGDHHSGSDLRAKSRLVRFLHRELGFDVLAFEAGMYGMAVADEAMRAGSPPRDAFALGAWPFWSQAAQMQPLIEYVGATVHTDRPLRLAGFDIQFVRPGAAEAFAHDVAAQLTSRGIASPLADTTSAEWQVLHSLGMMLYRIGQATPPDAAVRSSFLDALDHAVARLDDSHDGDTRPWARILRSAGTEARFNFARADGASLWEASRMRSDGMAENLLWLATERFPDRRIIAWAANVHVMRLPEIPPAGGAGPSMGLRIGEALGEASYVIAATSFEGPLFARDQHPLPDFETLMTEAGHDYGIVDLRAGAAAGNWIGGPFLARPLTRQVQEAVWSEAADALLFIRRDERSRPWRP